MNAFRVYARQGTPVSGLRQAIIERYAGRQVFVLTNESVKSYVLSVINQWFGLTTIQIALGVFVAILGIVNTLTVSISDRRRELAVLQAVGGLPRFEEPPGWSARHRRDWADLGCLLELPPCTCCRSLSMMPA